MIRKFFLASIALALAVFIFRSCFEESKISFVLQSESVGTQPFSVKFSGIGDGLKNIRISYISKDQTLLLETKNYPKGVKKDTVQISLSPFTGIEDGPGQIKAEAESYGGMFSSGGGSSVSKTKNITTDLSPPKITVMSGAERFLQGGSGVIIYKVSGDSKESGVKIGNKFFKGHKGAPKNGFSDKSIRIAFFSYPYNLGEGETVLITATDAIGNKRNLPVNYKLEERILPDNPVEITERFIKMKMAPLINAREDYSAKEMFVLVNKKIRSLNNEKIAKVLSHASDKSDKILWEGSFIRPVGSLQSQFEQRIYTFEGVEVDRQPHLGYDIASQKRNPVRASNNGIVIFADDLGIYGNTIIIDHGMGIATLYSHLSSMSVQRGETVVKGKRIGNTGATGLAFGDHLHFSIYVGGLPVEPIQWWDTNWVQTRITQNLTDAKRETN
ncbi:MAG: peptidoglycan DD-metalloendopeptidase family protein [Candidatus Mycalebacterium zealandia]|nr:MAG: peptidoglycan DD-metalloendopeptidase family protein [Candidatus Mycalebacterium zealandia]